jgi:uncharacterized protein involved in exopolysaccharide biosynthesis
MTNAESDHSLRLPTVRDLVSPIFRYWRAGALAALSTIAATTLIVLLTPKQYEAEMKFLVKRERADPIVSADPNSAATTRAEVTEDEMNSEVELLKSHDLLERVATEAGLIDKPAAGAPDERSRQPNVANARAVLRLSANLKVVPIRKTTFIRVTYRSVDPVLAARVLSALQALYFETHRALHRPPGAYEFFAEQANRFRKELADAEAKLNEFGRHEDIVSADLERQGTLQKLADFEAALQQSRARIAETTQSLTELTTQVEATPARHTTQVKTSANVELSRELKSRVLNLEMRRAEMLRKFTPTYQPVVQLEEELGRTRAALEESERSPLTEQTTDQNPTYQWLRGEIARLKSERAAAIAGAAALERSIAAFREQARRLEERGAAQQDLRRTMKSAEDSYLLYQRKQEEARISDALDRTRIANVAVVDAPTVPSLPSNTGRFWLLVLGGIMGIAIGIATTYVRHYMSPYFHTPDDVESTLGVPVLASLLVQR